ncbi:MAG: hypothetical protein MUF66_03985, partial [Gammaproteobacteria bacterium]|nr:hypothetical protein [Gammaproteobacteria bacterium]
MQPPPHLPPAPLTAPAGAAQTPAALEPTLGCPWPAGPLARLFHVGEAAGIAEAADTPAEWHRPDLPAVWQERLASFELALSPDCPPARAAALMDDWVRRGSGGGSRRWEPETLSRRVISWSKLFLRPDWRERVQPAWRESLYEQARWLERHLERASTGTALLTNAKALLFAGASLPGPLPERWVRRGLSLVEALAEIQVLPDGGQRDRSPMRHCQVAEDLLDVVNLLHTGRIDGGRDVRLR